MTRLYLIIFFFLVIPYKGIAQQNTYIKNISLVKESPAIDSLLNRLIANLENLKRVECDSCLLLGLFKRKIDDGFVYNVHKSNDRQKAYYSFPDFAPDKTLGYFNYNGYLVFVYGDASLKEYINYTDFKKPFIFKKPSTQESVSIITHNMPWILFYKNGVFSYGFH